LAVVGDRADRAGHVRAVPGAVAHRAASKIAVRTLLQGNPVARVLWIGVARVAVVSGERVRDEIVSADDAASQVDMGAMAGVNHSHDDVGIAGANVPGLRQVGFIIVSFFAMLLVCPPIYASYAAQKDDVPVLCAR